MAFRRICGLAILVVTSPLWCPPTTFAQQTISPRADPSGLPEPQQSGQPRSAVTFKDGRLTVRVQDRSLLQVLDQVASLTGIGIFESQDFSSQRISVAFENLPLEEGLRQLLKNYDSFFFFGVDEEPPATIMGVWIYPRGRGRSILPVPAETWASTKELRERLTNPDPESRAGAVEALVERDGDQARSAVLYALADADAQVRTRALYAAISRGVEVPTALLMQGLDDPSVEVRFLVLQALAAGPEARAAAERARGDSNPLVREQAEQMLKELGATTRPRRVQPRSKGPNR